MFKEIPPFPQDVLIAAMTTIPLERLRSKQDQAEREILNLLEDVKEEYQYDIPKSFLGFKPVGQAKTELNEPDRYESSNVEQDGFIGNTSLQKLLLGIYLHLQSIISYLRHCQDIVAIPSSALATQLRLLSNAFTSLQSPTKHSGTVIRFIKAFASPRLEDLTTALIQHTDFGTITLLANVVRSLQIHQPGKSAADESAWIWARPQSGCLIVNIAHRVSHALGRQRCVDIYSLVYLAKPEHNASMKRLVNTIEDSGNGVDDKLTAW
ncbi:hypothetical protein HD806DRAFT_543341 [Xylariaceae sp. AK1471]|nr:hypothetical protein HD806DRAFT_543341 [Xylariaceae sp. AK1471]